MPSEPRVFAIQAQAKFDVSNASNFGKIYYLCHDLQPLNVKDSVRRIVKQLAFHDYNPHADYLLMTGKLLECSYLLAVASKLNQAVRILIYDAKQGTYIAQVFGLMDE